MGTGTRDNPIRVLLVDDDEEDYVLTRGYLKDIPGRFYHLDWVAGYDDALAAICRAEHDVYLIDYRLDARDGLALLEEALGRGCVGPMILLTGQGEEEIDLAAMRAGAADYLEKSQLDGVRLERTIRYACLQKGLEKELEEKVRDRTRELEQEVAFRRRVEGQLRDADRLKDQFLAVLGHELRNPLVPIRNALGILQLAPNAESSRRAVELLERNVAVMVRLINDLVDVSRITRGKLQLEPESLDLREVIAAALDLSRPLLDQAGVTLTTRVPDDLPPFEGDRVRLAQVFANLLNNAAKFTPAGGGVTLTVEREASPEAALVVRVRDTGVGISAEQLPHIFGMFSQVGRSPEQAQGGLGVGLALVRTLVGLHGGSVTAASDGLDRGTEFTVRLPLAPDAAPR